MVQNTMTLVPIGSVQLSPQGQPLSVAGFENLDHTDMAVPYVRVIQPTSLDTELMDGSEAKPGVFYNVALRTQAAELVFSIVTIAKFQVVWQEGQEAQLVYMVLAADASLEPFVLKVSGTSIFNLKQLITSVDRTGAAKAWEWIVRAVTEKREGTKDGTPTKWYQIKFYLHGRNDPETTEALDKLADLYTPQMALPDLEVTEVIDE